MAEAIFNNQDLFFCSICLDVLKDPVTIHCGHSYCLGCINNCWDQDDRKGVYSCPQCRQTFTPRPVLNKSTVLAEVVEKLKKTGSQALCYAGPGDVECDFCTVRKLKAVKSCLVCLTSYCVTHLQPHYSLSTLKKHTLVKATQLQEKICSHHERLLEVYCRTDQQCICLLCVMEEHKGHDTVSAEAERNEKQKQFGEKKRKYQKRIQEREKELRELRQAVKTLKHTAGATVDESERIFTELIRSIERRRSEVKEQIRAQEKSAVSRVEGLLQRLEQEVAELKRKDTDLKELSNTEDHIQFLQGFQSLLVSPESYVSPCVTVNPHAPFEAVKKVLSDLRERLETMSKGIAKMSEKIQIDPDPKTKEEFVIYSCQLTMDPNTVFENLRLSEGNRTVTWSKKAQSYPDHPERFTEYDQVLCSEGLSGNCYWEVEWKGARVEIAVSYKGKGLKECGFGYSDQSWCLSCSHSGCTFWYNGIMTKISIPCSSRVGVYLDSRAGTLSFYSISDTMSLLHKVQTAFTQPLYPGFMVGRGASVKIMPPK